MQHAARILEEFGVAHESRVVSAHRTRRSCASMPAAPAGRGLRIIIAGAGGAAHLPGMVSSWTTLPVIGVPVKSSALSGLDSLLSIVQMPGGVPVATVAIGEAGAKNAGLLAVRMLANDDVSLVQRLVAFSERQAEAAVQAELSSS
jgi:5-(carboxyamino)imidazole ribonucleotide mutase